MQRKAYWVLPLTVREVPYAPMQSINFLGKIGSLAALFPKPSSEHSTTSSFASFSPGVMVNAVSQSSMPHASESSSQVEYSTSSSYSSEFNICARKKFCPPSSQELNGFFESLSKCSTKPAILSVVRGYSSKYIPNSLSSDLPSPLSHLFQSGCIKKTYYEMLQIAQQTEVSVTEAQAKKLRRKQEAKRKQEYHNRLWYRMRPGRITVSKLKAVCHTDQAFPSESLVMSICHPELSKIKSTATTWGCEHERTARERYKVLYESIHQAFSITECGLFINVNYPFLGASPDGLISCSCCGLGICEIKVGLFVT